MRLWWALPGLAVAGTAVGMAVVVGPTLGEHVTIPSRLVLPTTTPAAAQTPDAQSPGSQHPTKPRHHPTPPPTAAATSAVPQTHVVTPRRPLVTATSDDSHETDAGRDRSGVDVQGTDP